MGELALVVRNDQELNDALCDNRPEEMNEQHRGESRTPVTSKIELFVTIRICWKPLTIFTKSSIFNVAMFLDLPLKKNERI